MSEKRSQGRYITIQITYLGGELPSALLLSLSPLRSYLGLAARSLSHPTSDWHNLHGHGHNLHGHPGSKEVGVGRARPTLARRQRAARVHQLASAIASSVFWQTDRRARQEKMSE